jgi:hypothetical protein
MSVPNSDHYSVTVSGGLLTLMLTDGSAAIAAKPTNKRLRIGREIAQEIFIIRLPSINGALPECYEIHTEPTATNARLGRSGREFRS